LKEYHKIDSVFKRDERGKFIIGDFSRPEFEYLKDNPWLWTEKIDGTNIRVMWGPDGQGSLAIIQSFGGKTDNAQIPAKLLNWLRDNLTPTQGELRRIFNVDEMAQFPQVCLYGEGYGAGIQSGGNYSPEQKFILFDVKIGDWWLTRDNVEDIGRKLGLDVVKMYEPRTLTSLLDGIQDSPLSTSRIMDSAFWDTDVEPEGYVGTPLIPLFARNGDRIITKVKYKDFR